ALVGISDLGAERSLVDAIPRSRVTGHPRAIQLLPGRETRVWLARDLPETERAAGSEGSANPASQSGATDRTLLLRPSLRAHFRLPNGARAFAVFDDPNAATTQPRSAHAPSTAPEACRACHAKGAVTAVRALTRALQKIGQKLGQKLEQEDNADDRTDASLADVIERSNGPAARLRQRLAASTIARAIDVPDDISGLDPVAYLAARYTLPLDLLRAAGAYGVRPETLTGILSEQIATTGSFAARRLSLSLLDRASFDRLLDRSIGAAADPAPQPARPHPHGLVVWPNRETLRVGDPIAFSAMADHDCYLTLISIDARGDATMLYPNGLTPVRRLAAGEVFQVPAPDARYALRAKSVGQERILAFCGADRRPILSGALDLERQLFPSLGPWEDALIAASARYRNAPNAEQLARLQQRQRQQVASIRRRNRRRSRRRQIIPPPPVIDRRPQALARARATYRVLANK
ncbi:MAG: DUF4384 domain-containing protein, partial [Pseudomonadota bacterium]